MEELRKKLVISLLLIIGTFIIGTLGYMIVEGWGFLDSLYMTVITLASIGYKEVHDLSENGRVFTVLLIICGVGTVLYALNNGAKIIIEGELQEVFARKRLEKKNKALKDHYIICGFGRMGKIICRELKEQNIKFVAIEDNVEAVENNEDYLVFIGNATKDEVLKAVGIEQAKGLISVLSTDAENLYVVLSARELNPNLFIVARSSDGSSEQKLLRAGANRVASPYHIGGLRIAHTILKPSVVDFIEFATSSGNVNIQMEEITIQNGSKLIDKTLDNCGFGRDLGVIIVAIKRHSGKMSFNPTSKTSIKLGDTLIAIGESSKLKILEDMAAPTA